jgi:hypothetical protein
MARADIPPAPAQNGDPPVAAAELGPETPGPVRGTVVAHGAATVARDDGGDGRPRVAIVLWGHPVEDWLASLGLGVEGLAAEMTGGWLFGYCEALVRAGFAPMIFCVSAADAAETVRRHAETGTPIVSLPLTERQRRTRALLKRPALRPPQRPPHLWERPSRDRALWPPAGRRTAPAPTGYRLAPSTIPHARARGVRP